MNVTPLNPIRQQAEPVRQLFAIVNRTCEDGWVLEDGGREFRGERACGCLLNPQPGDRVLAATRGNETYILTVLSRDVCAENLIEVPGDLRIKAQRGRISLEADADLGLTSATELAMDAPCLSVRARMATALTEKLDWVAESLSARVGRTSYVGQVFDSILEHFSRKSRYSIREVEQLDQLNAGHIDQRAEGNLSLRAGNVLTSARELAKIDGSQIHLG